MSSKCLTLYCALVLLGCIAASQAEQRKTLQPLPLVQLARQSKDLRNPAAEELYPLDDEDGNDIVEDPADAELDDEENDNDLAALNENDDNDLELADDGSIAELTKLIESLEATLKRHDGGAARNIDGRAAPRRNRKNRCGANKRNGRRGRNGIRSNGAKRRSGQKRRNGGGKKTQRA